MSARPDLTTEPTELELAQLSTAMRDAGITEHGMLIFRRAMFQLSRLRSGRPAVTPEALEAFQRIENQFGSFTDGGDPALEAALRVRGEPAPPEAQRCQEVAFAEGTGQCVLPAGHPGRHQIGGEASEPTDYMRLMMGLNAAAMRGEMVQLDNAEVKLLLRGDIERGQRLGEPAREPTLEEVRKAVLAEAEVIVWAGIPVALADYDDWPAFDARVRARLSPPTPEVSRMEPFPLEREADE